MKNKKIIIVIIIIFAIVSNIFLLCFCNQEESSYHLIMTECTWGEYGVSDNIVREFEVKKDDIIYSNNKGYGDLTFEIISVSSQSITIKTNKPMSSRKSENDGIDLRSEETKFILKKGNTIFLTTPTMDGGANYKLELN